MHEWMADPAKDLVLGDLVLMDNNDPVMDNNDPVIWLYLGVVDELGPVSASYFFLPVTEWVRENYLKWSQTSGKTYLTISKYGLKHVPIRLLSRMGEGEGR